MILIVVKEDSALGVQKYINKLKSHGIDCLPFFIQPYESLVQHSSINLFNKSIQYKEYLGDLNNKSTNNLNDIEFDSISSWINSSVLNQRGSSGRNWGSKYKFSDLLNYINDCACYYDWVIKKYKPTAIIDFESDNIIRAVLDLICIRFKLPYYVYYSTRLDSRVTLGKGIINPTFHIPNIKSNHLKEAQIYIDNFRFSARLSPDEILFDRRNSQYNIFRLVKDILSNIYMHSFIILKKKLCRKINLPSKDLYYGGGFLYLIWKIKFLCRKYLDINFFGSNIERNSFVDNYFYFALGQTVEGSEPNFSGGFLNDIDCLSYVKSRIKSHRYRLLVKDHRSMLGDRNITQRNFINSTNIDYVWGSQLCSTEWMSSPQSLVFQAKGVFTLSGSVGLEAILSGVPAFIFGEPLYKQIMKKNGIKFPVIQDINDFLSTPNKYIPNRDLVLKSIAELISISSKYSLYQIKRNNTFMDIEISIDKSVNEILDLLRK